MNSNDRESHEIQKTSLPIAKVDNGQEIKLNVEYDRENSTVRIYSVIESE